MSILADTPAAEPEVPEPPAADPPASNTPPADPPASEPPAYPPASDPPIDDWRARMSGGDEKLLGYLSRVPSEKALVERAKKHEEDLKTGKYIKPLSPDASDEEKAAYRKASGVPDKIDDYLADLPSGLVIGDDDRGDTGLDPYLSIMHDLNMPKAAATRLIEAYSKQVEAVNAARIEQMESDDADYEDAGKTALKEEWQGADYKRNIAAVDNWLATQSEEFQGIVTSARGADGRLIGSNPEFIRALAALAFEANPMSTVVPGSGAGQVNTLIDEIATIKTAMKDQNSAYYKGPKTADGTETVMRARYRALLEAQEKSRPR
jgi:hypothetical protein